MTRWRLLPHVFVAGHRRPPAPTAYISGRTLRAAIAANAALSAFAGDDDAPRAAGEPTGLPEPATSPGAAPGRAAPATSPAAAPGRAASASPGAAAPRDLSAPSNSGRAA